MSIRLTCALCGRELHRTGVNRDLGCPLHGSRWQGWGENIKPPKSPSKPGLRDPDYDFGPSANS